MSTENDSKKKGNLPISDSKFIVRKGYVQAMDGETLLINTQTDELVKVVVKDKRTRWDMYCKHVKITIEEIDQSELG